MKTVLFAFALVTKVQAVVGANPVLPVTNWQAVNASLGKLEQAFGLKP